MSSQGTSNSNEEIRMTSAENFKLTTRSQRYEKTVQKKDEGTYSEKVHSTNSSPPLLSNGPLTVEKPNLDLIFHPPKSTIQKYVFNPNARAAQVYNFVEYLAQAPCAMSTLEVLQSCPTQRKNLLTALGALDLDNTTTINFNVDKYKLR